MKKSILYLLSLVPLLFISCTNDSINDLIDEIDTTNVTYTANVKAIIDNNCISCHASPPINGAPNSLTTYNAVKNAVQNGNLIERISKNQGESGMMPQGGTRLPQQTIEVIIAWKNQGFIE
jgi:uncharacterized membrane protein